MKIVLKNVKEFLKNLKKNVRWRRWKQR